MPKSSEIEGLLLRLEAAMGRNREIEAAIYNMLVGPEDGNRIAFKVKDRSKLPGSRLSRFHDGWLVGKSETDEYADNMPAYTASVDAALALVERMLPGSNWTVNYLGGVGGCTIWPASRGEAEFDGHKESLPLSILVALLRALSARAAP